MQDFNPRSHEGSDGSEFPKGENKQVFQSTLPRRERHKVMKERRYVLNFNPRSHEGSDVRYLKSCGVNPKFQSTLPRRERQYYIDLLEEADEISIHAPTKGATMIGAKMMRTTGFQSTLPRRERQGQNTTYSVIPLISIHAPTKGATIPAEVKTLSD